MGDILLQAVIVLFASAIGTIVGSHLSVSGPKKRMEALEGEVVALTKIVTRSLELGRDNSADITTLARRIDGT